MTKDNSIAKRLTTLRAQKGLSQSELAELSGIAPAQISRYESGANIPRAHIIAKLAKALGVQYSFLQYGFEVDDDEMWAQMSLNKDNTATISLTLDDETLGIAKKSAEIRGVSLEDYLKWVLVYGITGPK
ncbi:helix-turn-helix transcriptional regulator [Morganella morganii]|uniref:helix-turn-helix domain-containing protein n=1 Tax=Morganella morganii TaxID=582 RepID=UPI0028D0A399|nr:helix-turn-helix transcriptional regulator [Morganella morganii]WNP29343.1 helix-turn-helix transcriptional regulator [Morganella morganii]